MPENECGRLVARHQRLNGEEIVVRLADGEHRPDWLGVVQWRGVGESTGEPDAIELIAYENPRSPVGWWTFESIEAAKQDAEESFALGPDAWELCDQHMPMCAGEPHVWGS